MKTQPSTDTRRFGVVVHYGSVLGLVIFLYATLSRNIPLWVLLIGVALLIVAVVSYVTVHLGTGLWKFTWAKGERLDEREMQVNREAFRKSYNIIIGVALVAAILSLIVENSYFSTEAFLQKRSFNAVPLLFGLVHFAKTLPSSILAWTEREVYRQ